ncbi:preprotein translocase subunit YajC [Raineyella sp. LH-20]|uniref:preprotein translocase subunit YajC n=1 Tax=Raineyella sp. LH-20 TaxID=3081204 RepID=UPI002955A413|nr:preprotein translocase subunit YajC [Raineyella sp. LH-20]WOP17984.1 preprotein translocase subunit YajC [Raineyella sp. LH-20]
MSTLLMIVLFVALGYFMLIRPGRQQAKKQAELMKELAPGARVQTQIGLYGTLVEMGEVQARIEVAPDVVITVDKRLISGVTPRSRDEFHQYPDDAELAAPADTALEAAPTDVAEDVPSGVAEDVPSGVAEDVPSGETTPDTTGDQSGPDDDQPGTGARNA